MASEPNRGINLPDHLVARNGSFEDLPAVAEVTRVAETVDAGEPLATLEDIESDWHRPGFDPGVDVLLVFDGNRLAAYAEVPGWRVSATVHPDYRGLGIGTAFLGWIEQRSLDRTPLDQETRVGQTIPRQHRKAAELFIRHGYRPGHTSWVFRLPGDRTIDHPPLSEGIKIRPYRPEEEDRLVFRVIDDAFSEWPDREPTSFEAWQSEVTGRADFDPSLLLVATADGEVVGAAFGILYPDEGWVEQLAVRKDKRGRGLAKALLREAFEEFRKRGAPAVGLSTDSRTGALDLYLQVGMEVTASWIHYSKVLRPAGGRPD